VGSWAISVIAKNSEDQVIGIGDNTAIISSDQTTSVNITVCRKEGNGSFILSVSWQAGMVTSPSVTGELLEDSSVQLTFNLSSNKLSASCSSSNVSAGDYTLKLTFYDDSSVVWSNIVSISLLADETVSGSIVISPDSINPPQGQASITFISDLNKPLDITFTGMKSLLHKGFTMDVDSTTNETVDSYQWYLDGNPISAQTASSISFGSDLDIGNYNLALQVKKGSITTVKSMNFKVGPSVSTIEVKQANDIIQSGVSEIDFGTINQGDSSPVIDFTISNTGLANLDISTVVIEGADADQFSLIPETWVSQSIAPGNNIILQVKFDPTCAGAKTATIRISHNDPDQGDIIFTIRGTVTAGKIEIKLRTNTVNNDGHILLNEGTTDGYFTIENKGTGTLTITSFNTNFVFFSGNSYCDGSYNEPSWCVHDAPGSVRLVDTMDNTITSLTLNPNSSEYVNVTVPSWPENTNDGSGTIIINSNDSEQPVFTLNVDFL